MEEAISMKYQDGKDRCFWANPKNQTYIDYHDKEWGVPVHDDHKLFEMLILESFQAGLSWECVLNKREAFREAFDDFDVHKVSAYDEKKQTQLKQNEKIIRNQRKILAAVTNAQIFIKIQEEYGSFAKYLWQFTDDQVIYETGKTSSDLSDHISKDLKKRGMKFVGTTIIYSYLQAVGVIYSHEEGCFLCKQK
jgi:DNA-3-methyladenine glycosylase I